MDLTNQRFGRLLVVERAPHNNFGHACWTCLCDCGVSKVIEQSSLRAKVTASCGCLRREVTANRVRSNLVGRVFGKLTVVAFAHIKCVSKCGNKERRSFWLCSCVCGNTVVREGHGLSAGNIVSCGCRRSLPDYLAAKREIFSNYKRGAHQRGLSWELSFEQVVTLVEQPCHYCSTKQSNTMKCTEYDYEYNGIDRVDNSKGYACDNVVSACKDCNLAKRDRSRDDFLRWAGRIAQHAQGMGA
jgi:hypothetical protein